MKEWSIHEVSRLAGTTSRTLRHYDRLGLVVPARVGANGYRYYGERELVRLQRVLLLRGLGLGLPAIASVLARSPGRAGPPGTDASARPEGTDAASAPVTDAAAEAAALRGHLDWLQAEQERLTRQIAAVRSTITTLERKEQLMAEAMFDGFDHTRYKAEVEERWGQEAYARGDAWWRAKSPAEQKEWQAALAALNADWQTAAEAGLDPAGPEAQALARRHAAWLASVPGTPAASLAPGATPTEHPTPEALAYLEGLAELYVADARFAANYGGPIGGAFVRAALTTYASARRTS